MINYNELFHIILKVRIKLNYIYTITTLRVILLELCHCQFQIVVVIKLWKIHVSYNDMNIFKRLRTIIMNMKY